MMVFKVKRALTDMVAVESAAGYPDMLILLSWGVRAARFGAAEFKGCGAVVQAVQGSSDQFVSWFVASPTVVGY